MKAHAQEKVGCGNRAWPIRGMYGIINRGGRNFSIITSKTRFYKLPAAKLAKIMKYFFSKIEKKEEKSISKNLQQNDNSWN